MVVSSNSGSSDGGIYVNTTRCVCGTTAGLPLMTCDSCGVDQHVICMGIDSSLTPKHYSCEKCRPENHPYLKLIAAQGERGWKIRQQMAALAYHEESAEQQRRYLHREIMAVVQVPDFTICRRSNQIPPTTATVVTWKSDLETGVRGVIRSLSLVDLWHFKHAAVAKLHDGHEAVVSVIYKYARQAMISGQLGQSETEALRGVFAPVSRRCLSI